MAPLVFSAGAKTSLATVKSKTNPTAIIDQHLRANELRFSSSLGILQTFMTIVFAWGAAQLIGEILSGVAPIAETKLPLYMSIAILIGALIIKATAAYAQNIINLRASVLARYRLRQHILDLSFQLGVGLFPNFRPAEMANLLTVETDKLRDYFAEYTIQKKMAVYTPALILIAAATVNWMVALLLFITTPLIPLFMILIGKRAAEASHNNLEELSRLGNLLEDRLSNLNLLQQHNSVTNETKSIFEQSDRFRKSTMQVLKLAFLSGTLLEFFAAISVALIAVYLGLFFLDKYSLGAWEADITFAQGAFLLMLAPEFYLPLRKMGGLYHAKASAHAFAKRLQHLATLTNGIATSSSFKRIQGRYELDICNISSGNQHPIHQPFSCRLKPGESLLLEAPSGTGKTTLLDTLAGLRPPLSGQLLCNDEQVTTYNNPHWQSQVGYISQKAELIYGTVKENLALGRHFDDETIWQALAQAQLDKVIKDLPMGLDHFISEDGDFLSGGQIQRLAIARALLHRPQLLLLDEPIANLDQDTAERFMQCLTFHTDNGGMIIMASHRTQSKFEFTFKLPLHSAIPRQPNDTCSTEPQAEDSHA